MSVNILESVSEICRDTKSAAISKILECLESEGEKILNCMGTLSMIE